MLSLRFRVSLTQKLSSYIQIYSDATVKQPEPEDREECQSSYCCPIIALVGSVIFPHVLVRASRAFSRDILRLLTTMWLGEKKKNVVSRGKLN